MVRLGQLLHKQRLQRKLTLEQIEKDTRIKASFLSALEKGEYSKLPSPAYAKGFVKNYAAYLGLPKAEILPLFRREFDEKKAYKVLPDSLTKQEEFPMRRIRFQQSFLLVTGLFVLFVGFLLLQYRSAFFAPSLHITSPKQGAVLSQDSTVSGTTDSQATVTVNNEPVSLNSDGKFTKNVTLFPGKTAIIIKATNRFGKETVVAREVTVKQ